MPDIEQRLAASAGGYRKKLAAMSGGSQANTGRIIQNWAVLVTVHQLLRKFLEAKDANEVLPGWQDVILETAPAAHGGTRPGAPDCGFTAGAEIVTVTYNEIRALCNRPDTGILAIVEINDNGRPHPPRYVWRAFIREPEFPIASVNIDLRELLSMSEEPS